MLPTNIEHVFTHAARAKLVNGVLQIKLPCNWPQGYKDLTIAKFQRWAAKQIKFTESLPAIGEGDGRSWLLVDFDGYVRALNNDTLRLPLKAVRIGSARHSRLAQANTSTGVLTFSCFAIDGMPLRALRYLVLHELAHLKEANHSARFWALVARHEPDYKRQRTIAQAHHARMVELEGNAGPGQATRPSHGPALHVLAMTSGSAQHALPPQADPEAHPFGPLFAFLPV